MKKLLTLMFLMCGCSANMVPIHKHIHQHGAWINIAIMPAAQLNDTLKGNSQKADGSFEIPLNKK